MTFLKALEATKRRRTGPLFFWGKNVRFGRMFTPRTNNLQQESFAGQ